MHQLRHTKFVPVDIQTCWDFFSSPNNLKKITPEKMGFNVKNEIPEKMYEGLMIAYSVTPILGIPMNWITEITKIEHLSYFVDEQRLGPYKIWHHEHHFKAVEGGTEIIDILSYVMPLGFLGTIAHALFVKNTVKDIFEFRNTRVDEIFGS